MTPLIETLILVVIAIVVLFFVLWILGLFKATREEVPVNPSIPRESAKPVVHSYQIYTAPDLKNATTKGGITYTYSKTGRFFRTKDGDYYELVSSNSGAMFYIKDGTRKYLTTKEKELPTYSKDEVL